MRSWNSSIALSTERHLKISGDLPLHFSGWLYLAGFSGIPYSDTIALGARASSGLRMPSQRLAIVERQKLRATAVKKTDLKERLG
jgi:hypothetical protein